LNLNDANAINAERLANVGELLDQAQDFIEKVYLPDLLAFASFHQDWGAIGGGLSNYLAYGDLRMAMRSLYWESGTSSRVTRASAYTQRADARRSGCRLTPPSWTAALADSTS
jgi:Ni,Fe-hydrogenase I large subunit